MTGPSLVLLASSLDATLRWNANGSPAAMVVAAVAAAVWIAVLYANEQAFVSGRRRMLLALLRLASLALLVTMLAQPSVARRRVAPPRLVLLVDHSRSMDDRDVSATDLPDGDAAAASVTRLGAARRLLTDGPAPLLDRLRERFHVETFQFSEEVAAADPAIPAADADGADAHRDATRLGDAVDHALRRLPGPRLSAIVLFTDGINTAGMAPADAAARARMLGVPLYIVALGADRPRPDVSIADALVEEVVFPGDRLQIEATVRAVGQAGAASRVTLRAADGDEVLAVTEITLPADGEAKAAGVALRPTAPGTMNLVLEIDALPGEEDIANNRAELTVDVRERRLRVLLVDSTPSFEFRALKSLLQRDPAVDLRVLLQDADPGFSEVEDAAIRSFPASEADLLQYDVVLLADADPRLLPPQAGQLLQQFVAVHGGGLVLIAGPRFMPAAFATLDPMRTLLPVEVAGGAMPSLPRARSHGLRIEPTPFGSEDPSLQLGDTPDASAAIWSALPPIQWWLDAAAPKGGAQVLATGVPPGAEAAASPDATPVILRHYVGAGEVLMHATDETWRWRWRNDDRFFARYWGQAVRRLARGRVLRGGGALSADRDAYEPADPVVLRFRRRAADGDPDEPVQVELSGESAATRTVLLTRSDRDPHRFETTLRNLPPDRYEARVTSADLDALSTVRFTVSAPAAELARIAIDEPVLRAMATKSGGKLYTASTARRLAEELPPSAPVTVEQLPDEPLFNSPWLLAALCVTLGLEWLLRRRGGLP